jgi:dienelactone hydrolase
LQLKWEHAMTRLLFLTSLVVALAATAASSQTTAPTTAAAGSDARQIIEPFMKCPKKFEGQIGDYGDVLKFEDGTMVKTAADWTRRREEIRKFWHESLGAWSAVIEKPEIKLKEKETLDGGIVRQKIWLEVAKNPQRELECYLLTPPGKGPFPAVVVTWYNATESAGIPSKPGAGKPIYAFGLDLAQRGYVTLCLPGSGSTTKDKGMQPLMFDAYCAANACNALANLPEVDAKRIGITGFSYGGKYSMFGSCLYDKFACAVWVDGGIVFNEKDANANYWEPWYLGEEEGKKRKAGVITAENPRTGAYKKLVEGGHDLHELIALMAPRPFLVSGGAQDPPEHWVVLNNINRVYKLLDAPDRVGMTNRGGHYPTEESNRQMYAFFDHFLKGADSK